MMSKYVVLDNMYNYVFKINNFDVPFSWKSIKSWKITSKTNLLSSLIITKHIVSLETQ